MYKMNRDLVNDCLMHASPLLHHSIERKVCALKTTFWEGAGGWTLESESSHLLN